MPHLLENAALLGTELGVIGHDVSIVALERRIWLPRAIDHGRGGGSSVTCRDSLGVDKMAIAGSSWKNLIPGFPL